MFNKNEYITKILGYTYHTCQLNLDCFHCTECENNLIITPNFDTWEGFGFLLEHLKDKALLLKETHDPNIFWLFLYGTHSPVATHNKTGITYSNLEPKDFSDKFVSFYEKELKANYGN